MGLWVWWVWWVLIEDSVAIGFMRFTANGAPFLGYRGWMWVVGGLRKEIDSEEEGVCRFMGMVEDVSGFMGIVGIGCGGF